MRKIRAKSPDLKSLDFESHAVATATLQLAGEKENGRTAITTLYKSAIMLRVEERSPRDNDETGHVSACRKVMSQFRFVRILSLALRSQAPD